MSPVASCSFCWTRGFQGWQEFERSCQPIIQCLHLVPHWEISLFLPCHHFFIGSTEKQTVVSFWIHPCWMLLGEGEDSSHHLRLFRPCYPCPSQSRRKSQDLLVSYVLRDMTISFWEQQGFVLLTAVALCRGGTWLTDSSSRCWGSFGNQITFDLAITFWVMEEQRGRAGTDGKVLPPFPLWAETHCLPGDPSQATALWYIHLWDVGLVLRSLLFSVHEQGLSAQSPCAEGDSGVHRVQRWILEIAVTTTSVPSWGPVLLDHSESPRKSSWRGSLRFCFPALLS